MIRLAEDIRSLSDFKRDTAAALKQLRKSRRPMVLTVNGRAEMVVQDAASYQATLDALERAEANEGIRRGLQAVAEGRTQPLREAIDSIKATRGPRPKEKRG
ncbi:MAG TPA: type II toxin-antitoxin system Phd/YefM family antitoxin [Acidobacteriaceae bacterium]|nr:type II toxin-antitoxin system Phd/YefM family antitoxin [Acidobacteriaceae bacterium]